MDANTPVWRGYVVAQTETDYQVVSERDKQIHTVPKTETGIKTGPIIMPDGHLCSIDEYVFTSSMLFAACREYLADLRRHKKRRAEKRKINQQSD